MRNSHIWQPGNDPRRCPATEWRIIRYRNSTVRSLVQCSLPRDHPGTHSQARKPFRPPE